MEMQHDIGMVDGSAAAHDPNVSMGNNFLGTSPRRDLRSLIDTWRSCSGSSIRVGTFKGSTPFSRESRLIKGLNVDSDGDVDGDCSGITGQ